ncbi:2,3,4,5-tetrahydropyridine-2,6-dicarboxylate N-succinyltransferase [Rubrivirga litoralis]|uniref:2,3,4,5-tetrahydropyridine-2,6-dicarboxylate N-succinyltransferase n=1 Tax=Rubrivirga litoralis TaxID=3075598 RepID=A0ABU3BV60_9BACT|nr:2,3,4,5-tetrahydropyridine-2,6-dicarboxylate N-succinyltransferase [Rubrivirga sp. F394]MDT0633179.1 2,3,4,5-tetrahydropyridine-2,6-dicarboxylate N-succinyltransferase [Rubrivirga sp. F394]
MTVTDLQLDITHHADQPTDALDRPAAREAFDALLDALEAGEVRSAERGGDGVWRANGWVKRGILLGFRLGEIVDQSEGPFAFFDKDTYPTRPFGPDAGVRIVPGGSTVRRGAYLAPGTVCMPPMYVNVGAYVGAGTMVDSHALVGSCAQVGERVHLSAAAQLGGVLEPIGAAPVVVEDDVFVGGGCGVYEGTVVRERAVLAAGVILTRATRLYDLVNETVLRAEGGLGLEVPAGAVVVPGTRAVDSDFGRAHGLGLSAPCVVKYRDASTDASTSLEEALR